MGIIRIETVNFGNGIKIGFYSQTEFLKLFVFYFLFKFCIYLCFQAVVKNQRTELSTSHSQRTGNLLIFILEFTVFKALSPTWAIRS